ncbi:unnamed protein product [Diplocarpon coronariae]
MGRPTPGTSEQPVVQEHHLDEEHTLAMARDLGSPTPETSENNFWLPRMVDR